MPVLLILRFFARCDDFVQSYLFLWDSPHVVKKEMTGTEYACRFACHRLPSALCLVENRAGDWSEEIEYGGFSFYGKALIATVRRDGS